MLYLYPLLLQAVKGVSFQPWLRGSIDGITATQARALMSFRDRFRRGLTTNVFLHARLERRDTGSGAEIKREVKRTGVERQLIVANVRRMRKLVKDADPDVVEEVKWVKPTSPGTPTWSHDGIICTGETYKSVVKLTFAKGASLKDPAKLFNSSLGGNTRRAIDIHEGEKVDASAFKALIRAAVALNSSVGKAKPRRAK